MITVNPTHHIIVNKPGDALALNWKPELDPDQVHHHRLRLCREIEWDGHLHLLLVGKENILSDYMALRSYITEGRPIILGLELEGVETWLSLGLSNIADFIRLMALRAAFMMDPKYKV